MNREDNSMNSIEMKAILRRLRFYVDCIYCKIEMSLFYFMDTAISVNK